MRRRLAGSLPAVLVLAVLLGAWELYVDLGGADPAVLPPVHAVVQSLWVDRGLLWPNFLTTAEEVLLGMLAASALAFPMAVAMHFSRTLRRAFYPLAVASQTVPVAVLAPIVVLWLGFGLGTKLAVIAVISFFPIVVTTLAGLDAVDAELLKLMRTFDASKLCAFREVELPAALPGLFTGARIAIVVAVIAAVLAEWSLSTSGLGFLFQLSLSQVQVARAYACVVVLSVFAIALFALLGALERRLLPWVHHPSPAGAR